MESSGEKSGFEQVPDGRDFIGLVVSRLRLQTISWVVGMEIDLFEKSLRSGNRSGLAFGQGGWSEAKRRNQRSNPCIAQGSDCHASELRLNAQLVVWISSPDRIHPLYVLEISHARIRVNSVWSSPRALN